MSTHVLKLPPVKLINLIVLGSYCLIFVSAMLLRVFADTPGLRAIAQIVIWAVIIFAILKGHVLVQSVYARVYQKRVQEFLLAEYGDIINPESLTKDQLKSLSTPNAVTEGYLSEPAFLHIRSNYGEQTGMYSLMTLNNDSYLVNRYNNVRVSSNPSIRSPRQSVIPALCETQDEYNIDTIVYEVRKAFLEEIKKGKGLAYTIGIPYENGDKDLHLLSDDTENFKVLLLWSSLEKVNEYIAAQANNEFHPAHLEVIELTIDDVDNIFTDAFRVYSFRIGLNWAPIPLPARGLIFPTRNMVLND